MSKLNNIIAIVATFAAMGLRVVSITEMDAISIAAAKAAKAEMAVKANRHHIISISSANDNADEDQEISIDKRVIDRFAQAPVLSVAVADIARIAAAPAAKLSVAHRGNRRNGGKKHYFPLVNLPSERGIVDNGVEVIGLDNGWVLRGGYRDYDPELSSSLAMLNNRAARREAYEAVAEEVQGWKNAISAKRAARRVLYIERHKAFADLNKAKDVKKKAEKALRSARIATRAAETSNATSMAKAEEVRSREAAAMRKLIAAKAEMDRAQAIVNGINELIKDVGDNIVMAYCAAETQGLGYWVHERGSAPNAADVISAFAGKIAA